VAAYDTVPDPEDTDGDIDVFASFMRSTKAPSRDLLIAQTTDSKAGSMLFNQLGCNICHVRSITTSPAGTVINDGAFTVPAALGGQGDPEHVLECPHGDEPHPVADLGRQFREIGLVARGQDELPDPMPARSECLFADPADRQHESAQRDLAGHRDILANRLIS